MGYVKESGNHEQLLVILYIYTLLLQSSPIIQAACNNVLTIKKIVKQAAYLLHQQLDTPGVEEECIVQSIWCHFDGRLEQSDKDRLVDMLKTNFSCPINIHTTLPANNDKTLKEAIEMELTDHHLQCLPMFVNKVCLSW